MRHLKYLRMVLEAIQREPLLLNEGLPTTEEAFLEEFHIKIDRKNITVHVDIAPKSGEGHDYMFSINTLTGKINSDSITIGELIPEPVDEL